MYVSGKLVSRPDVITIYIACHRQKWSANISVLLQRQRTPSFSLNSLDFLFVPECSLPGKMFHYYIRYGEVRGLRLVCVDSVSPCGPRSNIDLTHYVWATFEYYFANYAIVLLPSPTSGDKIVYVRGYQAKIGGESSRLCGQCVCITMNPRTYFNVSCKKKPQNCTYILCCKQPPSLKSADSEIVFGLYNKQKFRFDNVTTCKPSEIPEYDILNILLA